MIHGVSHLLGSFDSATKVLSGEKYSSFVTAFPVLRLIKQKIGNNLLFAFDDEGDIEKSKFKRNFFRQYGNNDFLKVLFEN